MKNKTFFALLIVVLVWGGSVGASFASGMALGKTHAVVSPASAATTKSAAPTATPTASSSAGAGAPGQTPDQVAAGGQGGTLSQDQLNQLRQQFQNGGGTGGGAQASGTPRAGAVLRGGLTGTVESVNGNTLTVNTAQGPLTATLSGTTTITKTSTGTPADLVAGVDVVVTGQRGADGSVQATTVTIVPAGFTGGLGGFGGRGGAGGGTGSATGGAAGTGTTGAGAASTAG